MTTSQIQKVYETRKVRLEITQDQLDTLPILAQMFSTGSIDRFLSRFAIKSIDGLMTGHDSVSLAGQMSDYLENLWHGRPVKASAPKHGRIVKVIELELKLTAGQIRVIEILAEIQGMTFDELIVGRIADEICGMMAIALDCGDASQDRKFVATAYKIWGGDEPCYLMATKA